MNIHEKLQKVDEFLREHQFKTNYYGGVQHQVGMNRENVTVMPHHNPYDDCAYVIAVGLNQVMGYTLNIPYMHNNWIRRWEQSYQTKEELIDILQKKVFPVSCW